jgi:hypothetical protein
MVDKAGGEYLAVDIGPQPPPLVAMDQLDVDALPSPALLLLGISATRPAGLLGRGWSWVAYRSVGFARRAKRLDVPERWVSVELVTLRIAGPWYRAAGPVDLRERVVVCWTRDVVTLVKAKRSKNGTRPQNAGTWKSERWRWTSGLAGSIPLDTDADAVKALLREDAIMARQSKATAPDDGVSVTVEAVATHPTDAVNAASGGRFSPDPMTDDGRRQIASTLDALDRTPELVGMLRGAFEVLQQAVFDAESKAAGLADAEALPYDVPIGGDNPDLPTALRELGGIVERTGHPALRVVLEHLAAVEQTLTDTEARANAAETSIEASGESSNPPAGASVLGLIEATGAYIPVPKRWCDVTAADIFVGRKGDLWVVDAAMGERDEFTKGKGTVRVSQAGKSYARDFDPDDTAQVLVPAAVEAAHQVLTEHLGASVLLGETASVPA